MSKDKCPHCGKVDCVQDVAYLNVENYGSATFKLMCVHCGKPIQVYLSREVICLEVIKGVHKEGDFG